MQENGYEEFNIRRYWALVVKRRYIALAVALAVISAFTWGSLLWPKTYEASTTVLIERGSNLDPLLGMPQSSAGGVEDRLSILSNALTSRNMVERVIKKIYPASDAAKHEWLIDDLAKKLEVTTKSPRGGTTGLFEVKYRGKDPVMIRDVVNTLVGEYIEDNVGRKRSEAAGDYEFLKGQVLDAKNKLESSDRAVRDFKERYPGVDNPADNTIAARVDALESAKADAEIKLNESLRKRDSLQKRLSAEKAGASVKEVTDTRLNELNNQLMALSARYTDDYPEVLKVKSEIEELKKQASSKASQPVVEAAGASPARQQLKQQLAETDSDIASLRARYEGLSRQRAAVQSKLGNAPKEQEEWARLQRDRTAYQKTYDDLVQKLESASVSNKLELASMTAGFKVVDPAILPEHPVKPKTVLIIVLGIILGVAAGTGAALGLDNLARSFKDEESIETKFNLPVLATIPTVITETDRVNARKVDVRVFTAAGVYFMIILLVLAKEFLHR